jgi:hypothetical protein
VIERVIVITGARIPDFKSQIFYNQAVFPSGEYAIEAKMG